eukprot:CAMPEP_0168371566 /NCGR_PEP_ID=MMETSP0228-20121227/7838_1 /TAXON_ID=133427 /ORGANISM="Protoceratium reticulatum, Strain CCCM 535 (=CCMP 1889)" /LENGTH=275 /DNA_ID=CAMNT_0008384459 /DNA_START=52 /DNA_END=879 /DNA_ORIENTATION=-
MTIQPAVMPVTPLARGMWLHGGLPDDVAAELARALGELPSTAPQSSSLRDLPSKQDPSSQSTGPSRHPTQPLPRRDPAPKLPTLLTPSRPTLAGLAAEPLVPRPDAVFEVPLAPMPERSEVNSAGGGFAKYASRDPLTGRVWGAPSAFGKGQCLDCPRRSAPPSMRCEACQLAALASEPMAAEALEELRGHLGKLLARKSGREHACISQGLEALYARLQAGQVPQPVHARLLGLARTAAAGGTGEATREVATLAKEHWEQHKAWLGPLRRLLAKQ